MAAVAGEAAAVLNADPFEWRECVQVGPHPKQLAPQLAQRAAALEYRWLAAAQLDSELHLEE